VDDSKVRNRYIHSLTTYLLAGGRAEEPAGDLHLSEAVQTWRESVQPGSGRTVLILDQLEEILTLNPADWDAKEDFFRELGMLLKTEPVWALLSMREDYMGGLDRYLRFLPGHLRSRYRLDFLSRADAKLAMRVPAMQQRVDFKPEAMEALADLLAVVAVQRPGEEPKIISAPYIEPFQLQVVCRLLWKNIRKDRGDDFPTIEPTDIETHADIDKALTLHFSETVANVAERADADERTIRDWFEHDLITKQHFRSQTLNLPRTANSQQVLSLLEDGYLIRGNARGSSIWYELTHDRLIGPVLASNDTWRRDNLEAWQAAAYNWDANDRQRAFLLQPHELPMALVRRDIPDSGITDVERAFLKASVNQARENGMLARTKFAMSLLAWVVIAQAIVIVGLVIGLIVK